jgi:regulator of protease activity HflC (stomatin/prohibitin superfamily)
MFNIHRVLGFWRRVLLRLVPLYALLALVILAAIWIGTEPAIDLQLGLMVLAGLALPTLAIVASFGLAISYLRALYDLQGYREPFWHLVHCVVGQATLKPWLMVQEAKINTQLNPPESFIVRVGGPGNLIVRKDSAVVLEQAGRLTRVQGPGMYPLKRFERIYDIVDLRPGRWQFAVEGLSKEGIPVTCETDIVFEIYRGRQEPTEGTPFPMDEKAVFLASMSKWVRERTRPAEQHLMDWKGLLVMSQTAGNLRSILARYPLDRLIAPERKGQTPVVTHPRRAIRAQLEKVLTDFAPSVGARILNVELGQIKVDDAVTQQWIDSWRASWTYWGAEYLAAADAEYARIVGEAKSEAVARRIHETANILYSLARKGRSAFVRGAMIQLHLALRNIGADSLALTYLPAEATKLLREAVDLKIKP